MSQDLLALPRPAPSAGLPAGAALRALRAATSARHARLDASLAIAATDAGPSELRAHLRLLRAWLAPLEAWATAFADGPQDCAQLAPVARLARIESDLRVLGGDDDLARRGAGWPSAASAAWRWGVCYVVEGAQLGGQVLARRLGPRVPAQALAYLGNGGEPPGPRWAAVLAALDAALCTAADVAEACDGACFAFDALVAGLPARHPARGATAAHARRRAGAAA